jgi:predicted nucleic acid-binding Zn finger protein
MLWGMSRSRNGKVKRREDYLLERSFRSCPGCAADVHVFADVCRHCGGALEIALAG